jgi:predicted  nucleic acid-binding Zn-ribbon protein
MNRFADLWRLQEIDSALDTRRASLDGAREQIGETDELVAARATLAERRVTLREAESAQKDIELQADDLKAKITAAEQKLYSGTIKNPKELADLQADVDSIKRHLATVEDQDLEALGAVETAENERRTAEAEATALEAAWAEEQSELNERIARLTVEIAQYERERQELTPNIDPALLKTYDHTRRTHQGKGMARLDRNLCMGCRISLPTNVVNRARAGNALVQCPNCERILYA